jgi:hypothetical protein
MTRPYSLGDIVVFDSSHRQEKYIGQIEEIHIKHWGTKLIPSVSDATIEQKKLWYESGEKEVIIERYGKGPMFMGVSFGIGDF